MSRAALPLPPEVARRYELTLPVREEFLAPIGEEDGVRYLRGRLVAGPEHPEFEVVLPKGASAQHKAPFVLCLPILAGGEDLIWAIGKGMADRGYVVAWTRRVASALKPGQRGAELEQLFRRTVVHDRALLAWARRQPEVDASRLASLGVSFGGMVGTALLAVEPDVRAGALCLAGGDLADLIHVTSEGRARSWLRWRQQEDGIGAFELTREIEREAGSDPMRMGVYVATDRTFLITATLDTVVPVAFQDLLWESLGRPQRMRIPTGHYSAALALGSILSAIDGFFRQRLG